MWKFLLHHTKSFKRNCSHLFRVKCCHDQSLGNVTRLLVGTKYKNTFERETSCSIGAHAVRGNFESHQRRSIWAATGRPPVTVTVSSREISGRADCRRLIVKDERLLGRRIHLGSVILWKTAVEHFQKSSLSIRAAPMAKRDVASLPESGRHVSSLV
jgi:hypothetical protein